MSIELRKLNHMYEPHILTKPVINEIITLIGIQVPKFNDEQIAVFLMIALFLGPEELRHSLFGILPIEKRSTQSFMRFLENPRGWQDYSNLLELLEEYFEEECDEILSMHSKLQNHILSFWQNQLQTTHPKSYDKYILSALAKSNVKPGEKYLKAIKFAMALSEDKRFLIFSDFLEVDECDLLSVILELGRYEICLERNPFFNKSF